jgi:hypothetical protein
VLIMAHGRRRVQRLVLRAPFAWLTRYRSFAPFMR